MAKPNRNDPYSLMNGASLEQITAELALHEMSYEACLLDLFGPPLDTATSKPQPNVRVTQAGPGRRNSPKPKKPEEK